MKQASQQPPASSFIEVSRTTIWGFSLGLLFFTGLMMTLCLKIDFPLYLAEKEVALKVGTTVIDFPTFQQLKALVVVDHRQIISDRDFAAELLETLLLAEAGRKAGLDREPDFQERIRDFDDAIAKASDPQILPRTMFLLEELATRARDQLATDVDGITELSLASMAAVFPSELSPLRMRAREILVDTDAIASQALLEFASGTPFSELNSRYSRSPYSGVGGDRGWLTPRDLPPGGFSALETQTPGSLTRLFADELGVHLFLTEKDRSSLASSAIKVYEPNDLRLRRQEARKQLIRRLQQSLPWFVHPQLLSTNNPISPDERGNP